GVEHIGWLGIRDCPSVAAVCFDKTSAVAEQKVDMIKDRARDFPKIYVYGTTASSGDVWYADENGDVVLVNGGDEATEMTFSIYWGINGRSFYDSASGELVKDVFADAEIYATTLAFTDAQKKTVSDALSSLNVDAYPNVYAPYPDGEATLVPPYTVILKVGKKQITCDVDGWISEDEKGQRFLTAVKNIIDVIVSSEEWKALPDYEPMD
ncbi:MAG: hypothetical protein J5903_04240, partial [Clostridia bacterium]|nr:hypothetical protein [Clostridia bacterium]